jgi:anthranilate phosphoribosyltransferase
VLANLGAERSWVVAGSGGIDELTITGSSVVFEVTPDGVRRFELSPADAGLSAAPSLESVAGGSPGDNAEVFTAILEGGLGGPKRDIVLLNAGAGLVVAGMAESLAEGVEAAAAAVDDGRAAAKLAELVKVTTELS